MIERIVIALLLSYSIPIGAQDPVGQKQWSEGVYKEHPFSYPASLSEAEINGILSSIKSLSVHGVFVISFQSEDKIMVKTCTHGLSKPLMCDAGEVFIYQRIKTKWNEIPEQRSRWVQ